MSGTPTVVGDFNSISFTVTDHTGATTTGTFHISIHPPMPRTFVVNTTADTSSVADHDAHDSNGNISMRSAIDAANADAVGPPGD